MLFLLALMTCVFLIVVGISYFTWIFQNSFGFTVVDVAFVLFVAWAFTLLTGLFIIIFRVISLS
jgi:uncharacterized membrane protein